jgi:hypothetical protein
MKNSIGRFAVTVFLLGAVMQSVAGQARQDSAMPTPPATQTFALTDVAGLIPKNVDVKAAEYKGRKAVLVTSPSEKDGFAVLPGTDFQDGTIEGDIALKTTTPPGVRMPGFVGIAFRARPDASRYDLFYLRPGNSHADDQAMRNHSVQYVAAPDFDWNKPAAAMALRLREPCGASVRDLDSRQN